MAATTSTAAEINIDCLRAAESLLRDHDAKINTAAEELKALKRDRVTFAERVQHCIDILCGRATPDLFTAATPPPVAPPPAPSAVTPPLAPGEYVELDDVRAAKLGEIAALQTPDLEPVVDWLLNDTETDTVGELWDWIDSDYGGMRHAGLTAMMRKRAPKEYLPHAQSFADAVMMFIVNNGHAAAVAAEKVSGDPPADELPLPPVTKPVGAGLLRDIPGITAADTATLDADGLRTLADLEAMIAKVTSEYFRETRTLNQQIYKVLNSPLGKFVGPDADRIANAITGHLKPATVPAVEKEDIEADDDTTAVEPADLTAEYEQRLNPKTNKSPGNERALAAIAEWRRRQAEDPNGEPAPVWGMWAEFQIYLADGSMVAVLYDPTWGAGVDHIEFHGAAVSETGYRSHFEQLKAGGRRPKTPLVTWAKEFAEKLSKETAVARGKGAKKRLKAPPAGGKPTKSKGKVKA